MRGWGALVADEKSGKRRGKGQTMSETFTRWNVTDHLRTEEDARLYLEAAFAEDLGNGRLIRAALKDIARACNMSDLAQRANTASAGDHAAVG